jgi:hypothetical protein
MLRGILSAVIGLCALFLVLVSSPVQPAPAADNSSAFSAYTVSMGPAVLSRHGIRTDSGEALDARLLFDPALLRLAREGHAQNIRLLGDGKLSLLADGTAATTLRMGGSALQPVLFVPAAKGSAPSVPLTTTIAGTVSVSGGSGLAGATVSAFSGGTTVTTTTQAGGTYTLDVPDGADYQVGVFAAGYQWQPAVLVAAPPGAADVNFSLVPQNLTIRGRITKQANIALPGVDVFATDLVYDNFAAGDYTTTDANGNYTLTVSTATYEVRAFAPPSGTKSRTVAVPPSATGKDFRFNVPTMYTVSGTVRKSDGQPLPGGELSIASTDVPFNSCDSWYSLVVTVGSTGQYSVSLPAGAYSFSANWPAEYADHWVIQTSTSLDLTGNTSNFNLTLPAVSTIQGTVLDPNGLPLPNATVFSWRGAGSSPWFDGFFNTDETGSFIVTATLGTHSLMAISDAYPRSATQTVNLGAGGLTGITLQVHTGIAMSGMLTGSDGPGLRWAALKYVMGDAGATFNRRAVTYYNGSWRAVMDPGNYTLNASQAYYTDVDQAVSVAPSPPAVDITLPKKTVRIGGSVKTVARAGLCDTYMTATNTGTGKSAYANSTGDGDYAMMVPAGTYNVWPYKYSSNSSSFENAITVPPAVASLNYTITEVMFTDVTTDTFFFEPIGYMIYNGIANGYPDGTFRPYNNTTRGQLSKMVVLGEGWAIDTSGGPHFNDVPTTDTFYQYIETAYNHGLINGYGCGTGCMEFRTGNNITRGQLAKIVVSAQGWALLNPATATFTDVPPDNTFYQYVETAYGHGILSGYSCGTGCLEFKPGNSATRGQIAKILYNALSNP